MTRKLQSFINQAIVDGCFISALIFIEFLNNIIHELLDLLLFFSFKLLLKFHWEKWWVGSIEVFFMTDQDLKVIKMSGEQVAGDLRCFEDDVLGLVALDVDQAYKVGIVLVPAPPDVFQGFLLAVALGFQEEVLSIVY